MAFVLLTACVTFVSPSKSAQAAPGGMMSAKAMTAPVQRALLVQADTASPEEASTPDGSRRFSPGRVALISAVAPGFGQIYNHSAWKLPIYYSLLGYFAYRSIDDNRQYNNYRKLYAADPGAADASANAGSRDKFRKKRNTQILLLAVTYVAGIVDAYVDSQLYDFDKVTGEGLGGTAPFGEMTPALSVSMKF
jgi:hypothetical protein